jgi:hypothetical protein
MKQIAAAFVKAQKSFAPALKTNANPAFKGSKYADLGSCIDAVIDALNSNGIALLQPTHEDATGVTVETIFLHESGEQLSGGKLHVPAPKQDPQGYGSALTYARRYSLMSSCGIAPEDDDGNAASAQQKPARQMKPLYVSPAQAEQLALLADEVNADLPALFDWISKRTGRKVLTFAELQINELQPVTAALNAKKEPA